MTTFKTPTVDLPEDVSTLHAMVRQLLSDAHERNRQIDDLQSQLEWFKRHVFGRRSEKLSPNQLTLFQEMTADQCEDEEQDTASEESNHGLTDSSGKPKKHLNGRRPLPEDLPRERIEYHPAKEDLICSCCGQTKQAIGEEVTEELDYVPASFVVRQHCRVKYACKNCQEGVVIADPITGPTIKENLNMINVAMARSASLPIFMSLNATFGRMAFSEAVTDSVFDHTSAAIKRLAEQFQFDVL